MKPNYYLPAVLLGLAVCLFVVSCATPNLVSAGGTDAKVVVFDDVAMTYRPDSPQQTKKNADRVFNAWAKKVMIDRVLRGRHLQSVARRDDGIHLIYGFSLPNVGEQRVELIVPDGNVKHQRR